MKGKRLYEGKGLSAKQATAILKGLRPMNWEGKTNKDLLTATHKELCDNALKHYEKISKIAMSWNSTVSKAIEFYKEFGPKLNEPTRCQLCGLPMSYTHHCNWNI